MTCLFCRRDLRPCREFGRPHACRGWVHDHNVSHACYTEHVAEPDLEVRTVHLLTGRITLACGSHGNDPASPAAGDVTCFACKQTPAWRLAVA